MKCPNCGGEKLYTYDNQSLANVRGANGPTPDELEFGIDHEVYAMAKCHTCDHKFNIRGDIKWEEPKPMVRKHKVRMILEVEVETDQTPAQGEMDEEQYEHEVVKVLENHLTHAVDVSRMSGTVFNVEGSTVLGIYMLMDTLQADMMNYSGDHWLSERKVVASI